MFVLLPLCIFRKTRSGTGAGLVCASYVFGIHLFAFCCVFVAQVWGYVGLAIGLILAGMGVLPIALIAALLHAEWIVLFNLVVGIILTFGTRALGVHLSMIRRKEEELQPGSIGRPHSDLA